MAQSYRRRQNNLVVPTVVDQRKKKVRDGAKQFESQWKQLRATCLDEDSQGRLVWLREQYDKKRRGVSEAAQAEIDIASLMTQAGFAVSFLKESETRTADLECYFGSDRLFVEVTVIVPTEQQASEFTRNGRSKSDSDDTDELDILKHAIIRRVVARIREKAQQLDHYCAPVILAITIANEDPLQKSKPSGVEVDLLRLSGVVTSTLQSLSQVSGALLTFQNIQPRESQSNIRLSNVHLVERAQGVKDGPQARLLAVNPIAAYPVEPQGQLALRQVL